MPIEKEFIEPGKKLVDGVAEWLLKKVKIEAGGAKSLAHLLVIVPTAQAGRNLRLTLAKKAAESKGGGLLPPKVVLPFTIIRASDESLKEASEAEVSAMFLKFYETRNPKKDKDAVFTELDQMADIWHILTSKGLMMRDVVTNEKARSCLEAAMGNELERWEELAKFEEEFFAFLHSKGLRHHAEAVSLAKSAAAPLPEEIEEIILPALSDPSYVLADVLSQFEGKVKITTLLHASEKDEKRFDEWGRPKIESWTKEAHPILENFTDEDILSFPDALMLSNRLVEDFPKKEDEKALPTLGLCDAELYTEIAATFLSAGYLLHNPERNELIVSSLGRLVSGLIEAWNLPKAGLDFVTFANLLKSDDILRELKEEGLIESRADELVALDKYQNERIPNNINEGFSPSSTALLSWLEEARKAPTLSGYLRSLLARIFSKKYFADPRAEKEFSEAAKCVRDMIDALESDSIKALELPKSDIVFLARRLLKAASYSLESVSSEVVKTEGWLELVWSANEKIALVGLHEGAVPDSVVGHPFLPNELRAALGLTTNETRLARDSWLLKELVDSHPAHSIRAYVSRTNGKGDICKPSRLLFLCKDEELAKRVKNLFGETEELPLTPPREVTEQWRLKLPEEVPLKGGRLSSSAIDVYLSSPLVYLLKYGLGMKDKFEEKKELDFNDFGAFVHHVLEKFALEEMSKGESISSSAAQIELSLKRIIEKEVERFGDKPTINLKLQLKAAEERLLKFAALQAKWVEEGWRIEGAEVPFEAVPFPDLGVSFKGYIDRIDYRVTPEGDKEYRLLDYKSWDDSTKASGHIKSQAQADVEFAERLKLPLLQKKNTKIRMLTTQLPLYGKCLETQNPKKYEERIVELDYLVLMEDEAKIYPMMEYKEISILTARKVIERIKANIFWPPRASEKTSLYDFGTLFSISPERDFGVGENKSDWLKAQEAKLKALEEDENA